VYNGGTKMTDIVEYALPFGLLRRVAHVLQVRRNVERFSTIDYDRIQQMFGRPPQG
jgi:hypothetical protein